MCTTVGWGVVTTFVLGTEGCVFYFCSHGESFCAISAKSCLLSGSGTLLLPPGGSVSTVAVTGSLAVEGGAVIVLNTPRDLR